MNGKRFLKAAAACCTAAAGAAAAGYAAYVALAWSRYGRPSRPQPDEQDELLDRFLPQFDVVERHHVVVNAAAPLVLDVAKTMELSSSPVVNGIFKAREVILGAAPDGRPRPKGLLDEVLSLGWVVLGEVPGNEIVLGAVTRPWEANVTFRSIPPHAFAAFDEPGYVKIAWNLRADAVGAASSIFRTETRAIGTDADARARFRPYWSFLSPGILMIRRMSLRLVKKESERRSRNQEAASAVTAA